MTRVIERCPSCGVEHEVRADGCEACGTALRYWCRTHSREIGWLQSAECRRCAEEEARRMPRSPVPAAPPRAAPPPAAPAPTARRTMAAPPPSPAPARVSAPPPPTPAAVPVPAPPPVAAAMPAPAPPAPRERATVPPPARVKRPGLLLSLFDGLLTVLGTGIIGTLLGVMAGGVLAVVTGADIPYSASAGGMYAGGFGLALGLVMALARHTPTPPTEV